MCRVGVVSGLTFLTPSLGYSSLRGALALAGGGSRLSPPPPLPPPLPPLPLPPPRCANVSVSCWARVELKAEYSLVARGVRR